MEKILMLIGVFAIVSCNSGSGGGSSGSAEAEMCSFDNFTAFLFTDKKYRIDSSYVGDAKEESIEGERCEIREDKVSCTSYDDTSSHNAYEIDRETYVLKLRDYEVKVTKGKISVPQKDKGNTQYIKMKWTDDPAELIKSARDGSLCARIFLRVNNISWD